MITEPINFLVRDLYLQFHIINREATARLLGECSFPYTIQFLGLSKSGSQEKQKKKGEGIFHQWKIVELGMLIPEFI